MRRICKKSILIFYSPPLAVNCGIFFAIAALHGGDDNYLVGYKLASANSSSGEDGNYRCLHCMNYKTKLTRDK